MKSIANIITGITIGYVLLFLSLNSYARSIARPTNGGISTSEVLEGIFPGGLDGLLVLFAVLVLLTFASWIAYFYKHKNSGSKRAKLRALIVALITVVVMLALLKIKSAREDNIPVSIIPINQYTKKELIGLPPISDGESGELHEDQIPDRVQKDFAELLKSIPGLKKEKQ